MWPWLAICAIMLLGGIMLGWWLFSRKFSASVAASEGRAVQILDLEAKVKALESELRKKWAAEAQKDLDDAAKVTDLPGTIDFARNIILRAGGQGPDPGPAAKLPNSEDS